MEFCLIKKLRGKKSYSGFINLKKKTRVIICLTFKLSCEYDFKMIL